MAGNHQDDDDRLAVATNLANSHTSPDRCTEAATLEEVLLETWRWAG